MAVVLGLGKITPFGRGLQTVCLEITFIPHNAVSRTREAIVLSVWVIQRISADHIGDTLGLDGDVRQKIVVFENFEGIWCRGPEDIRSVVVRRFLNKFHTGRSFFVQNFQIVLRVRRLERSLNRAGHAVWE